MIYCKLYIQLLLFILTFSSRSLPVGFPKGHYSGGQPANLAIRHRAHSRQPFPAPHGLLLLPGRPPGSVQAAAIVEGFDPTGKVSVVHRFRRARREPVRSWLANTEQEEKELFSGCGREVLQPGLHQEWYRTLVLIWRCCDGQCSRWNMEESKFTSAVNRLLLA